MRVISGQTVSKAIDRRKSLEWKSEARDFLLQRRDTTTDSWRVDLCVDIPVTNISSKIKQKIAISMLDSLIYLGISYYLYDCFPNK